MLRLSLPCRLLGFLVRLRGDTAGASKVSFIKRVQWAAAATSKHRSLSRKARATSTPDDESSWKVDSAGERRKWLRDDLHLVLVQPVIPQNVGNIARTCAATGVGLHLVGPLGFRLDDRKLKRAGLDYWPFVAVRTYDSWQDFYAFYQGLPLPKRLMAFSKFGTTHYASDGQFNAGDWLLFGAETTGLPDEVHHIVPTTGGSILKIPMKQTYVRSLNLSVSVGIGVYEAIRQLDGPFL